MGTRLLCVLVEGAGSQLWRRGGMGTGTEYALEPAPTPPRHVSGGNVFVPWADGWPAAQNM